jgi:hypothetical protein
MIKWVGIKFLFLECCIIKCVEIEFLFKRMISWAAMESLFQENDQVGRDGVPLPGERSEGRADGVPLPGERSGRQRLSLFARRKIR